MSTPRSSDPPPPSGLLAWSITWRYVLVLLVGAALLLATSHDLFSASTPVGRGHAVAIVAVDLAAGLLGLVVMALRRRWPLGVVVVLTAMTGVSAFAAAPWAIALVSLATRRRWLEVLPIGVASLLAQHVYGLVNPFTGSGVPWWVSYALGVLTFGVLVMIGFYTGARRELLANLQYRAETAEREQAMRVAQARVHERTRIAREMHDVLAHRMSLVAMHAGALTFRDDLTRDQTRRTAQFIQDGVHLALSDLREVLGVLRDPTVDGEAEARQPQPTLRDLPSLVAEAVEGGMRVELLERIPAGAIVPDATGRTIYRMTQESLTNARKHAPGMPVTVTLTGAPGGLIELEIRNPLPVRRVLVDAPVGRIDKPLPGSGTGLTGLAERAVLADGDLEHGVTSGREFLVRARLPWPA
ncbi:histidine kinase [Actinotalea sp. K2]|uniref:sensor histidine kinase n=1 Tax=Actinotalea sp. K2 TaxID=2939438 RepID=UPI002017CE41|nr:histidine kinase [Actinotalea sp. K2]MCL3862152.1 histidine kinase [Actinotalea sp. K2]